MQRGNCLYLAAIAGALAFAAGAPRAVLAAATPLTGGAAGWVHEDIGTPSPAGSASVDGKGVLSISAGGDDIWSAHDDFHYAYEPVKGDATIVMRYLSMTAGDGTWTKVGPMIRATDATNSPEVCNTMTSASGIDMQGRLQFSADSTNPGPEGDSSVYTPDKPVFLMEQRVGNDIIGAYSTDGKLWTQLGQIYNAPYGDTALFGIALTSHQDGTAASAKADMISVTPGGSLVYGVQGSGDAKSFLIGWPALSGVDGYNVYRGPANTTDLTKLAKVNSQLVTSNSLVDASGGLVNQTQYTYAIRPVVKGVEASGVSTFQLTPSPLVPPGVPPGFQDTNIGEQPGPPTPALGVGSGYDPATGTIIMRGAGHDIWDSGDHFDFVNQPVTGNFQVTVEVLTLPTHTNDWAKAGLMVREGLYLGARDTYWTVTPSNGLAWQYREGYNAGANWGGNSEIAAADLKVPIWIRMTRKGDLLTGEYSTDGTTWKGLADQQETLDTLAPTVYVGLCLSSHQEDQISQVTFQNLKITPQP